MEGNPKTEFHTIDALRFFAFFKVFLLHLPTDRYFLLFGYLKKGGGIGVSFFFVLSGFLITYSLSEEKMQMKNIAARASLYDFMTVYFL